MAIRTYARRSSSFVSDSSASEPPASQSSQSSSRSSSQSSISKSIDPYELDFGDVNERGKRPRSSVSSKSSSFTTESTPGTKLRRSSSESKPASLDRSSTSFTELKEHGAQRSLLDRVEYALDGLEATQGLQTRRTCALELATLCATNTELSFLFRAHGMFDRTMELLRSCNDDKVLWLAAATIMYFLFKDKLNTEYVSAPTLSLLVWFMSDSSTEAAITAIRKFGRAPEDYISALRALYTSEDNRFSKTSESIEPNTLALHTLAHLSTHQPSLRDSLRTCGLLDIICRRLGQLSSDVPLSALTPDTLEDVTLLLSILENVTFLNRTTQEYLSSLPQLLPNVATFLCRSLSNGLPSGLLFDALQLTARALVNLTHKNSNAARILMTCEGIDPVLRLLKLTATTNDPQLYLLSIGLVVNLLEESKELRAWLREQQQIEFLVQLYLTAHHQMIARPEVAEETITSFLALLIGCLVKDDAANRADVLQRLPTHSFDDLITRIGYFIAAQLDNGVLSREAHRSYVEILEVLDPVAAAEARRELSKDEVEQ